MKREEIKEYRNTFSEKTISEIAELYDSGEKIVNIIEKYQLEISPGQMTYFLPRISTEYICPYCKVPMGTLYVYNFCWRAQVFLGHCLNSLEDVG